MLIMLSQVLLLTEHMVQKAHQCECLESLEVGHQRQGSSRPTAVTRENEFQMSERLKQTTNTDAVSLKTVPMGCHQADEAAKIPGCQAQLSTNLKPGAALSNPTSP